MEITTIGLDLAKSVFQLHAVDADGAVVWRKKVRRGSTPRDAGAGSGLPGRNGGLRNRPSLGA